MAASITAFAVAVTERVPGEEPWARVHQMPPLVAELVLAAAGAVDEEDGQIGVAPVQDIAQEAVGAPGLPSA